VGYLAAAIGIQATVVMPAAAVRSGRSNAAMAAGCLTERFAGNPSRDQKERDLTLPTVDDPHIIAGQGTVGLEIPKMRRRWTLYLSAWAAAADLRHRGSRAPRADSQGHGVGTEGAGYNASLQRGEPVRLDWSTRLPMVWPRLSPEKHAGYVQTYVMRWSLSPTRLSSGVDGALQGCGRACGGKLAALLSGRAALPARATVVCV
jgi:hypothetical protein